MRRIVALLICLTFLFSLGGISSAAMKVYYYHTDPSGTPMAVSDSSGNIVWRATYKPFGQEQSVSGSIENNERFIGKEKDKETGLVYINHRYYMPEIGRFISPDSVTLVNPWTSKVNMKVLFNPQLLNRYAYGLNNPYRYVDPNGHFILTIPLIVAGLLTLGELSEPQTMGSPHQDSFMAQHGTDVLMLAVPVEGIGEEALATSGEAWAKLSGMLRDAAAGKGSFGIGSATREEAEVMGKAWVGESYDVASDGKTLISSDGLRQYRPPEYKPRLGKFQANFEQRFPGQITNQWQSNAHLDIIK